MGRMTLGQKAERILQFLMGLRNAQTVRIMAAYGFTQDDMDEGWTLLQGLTVGRLDNVNVQPTLDPSTIAKLDAWENRWFPIATASLRTRHPEAYETPFRNLTQTDGAAVVLSVGTFITRLKELRSTDTGKEVCELLARRGITAQVIADAEVMVSNARALEKKVVPPSVTPEEDARREEALWEWYREWGTIARTVISDRRHLRNLGFLDDSGRSAAGDEEIENEVAGIAAVPVATATSAGTASATKPNVPLGGNNQSPFLNR